MEHSGSHPVKAVVHWCMHYTGWEDCMCDRCLKYLLPCHVWYRQTHTIFRGFISISGRWVLLYKKLNITAGGKKPHITVQHIAMFWCSLGALVGIMCCDTARAKANELMGERVDLSRWEWWGASCGLPLFSQSAETWLFWGSWPKWVSNLNVWEWGKGKGWKVESKPLVSFLFFHSPLEQLTRPPVRWVSSSE